MPVDPVLGLGRFCFCWFGDGRWPLPLALAQSDCGVKMPVSGIQVSPLLPEENGWI